MMKTLGAILAMLVLGACGGPFPTAPTRAKDDPHPPMAQAAPGSVGEDAVTTSVTVDGPGPGCQPSIEPVKWIVRVKATELVRLYPHAFRSPKAGCSNTIDEQTTMHVIGLRHYLPGESGETHFRYEADPRACGRVEVGAIWKNAAGADVMLAWRVIDSGRDCPTPPPPPPPSLPSVPPLPPPTPSGPPIPAACAKCHTLGDPSYRTGPHK